MHLRHSLKKSVRCAVLLSIAITNCAVARAQSLPAKLSEEIPDLMAFLPEEATLTKQMTVDFTNGRKPAFMVIAYQMRDGEGLRILAPGKLSAWSVAYEETDPGEPVQDNLILHKAKAANGQEGLVVVYYHSGAGTTTDWKIIAESEGKFLSREAAPIRDRVLKKRQLMFGGYNGVVVRDDFIIETISGYSGRTARCCPDKPAIEMRVKFTGTSIKLQSVQQLASEPLQKLR